MDAYDDLMINIQIENWDVTVIDLDLEMLDFLVKLEDGLSDVLGVQLVVPGKFRDHGVIGIESEFHHPLALEDLLLHCFKPCLHASGLPWPLNIAMCNTPSRISMV